MMPLPPPLGPSPDQGMGSPTPVSPPGGAPPGPMPPGAPPPGLNGIPGAMGMPTPPYPMPMNDPSTVQYGTQTQQDGTVLIYIQNPDGSPGPVIHVWKPPGLHGGGKK